MKTTKIKRINLFRFWRMLVFVTTVIAANETMAQVNDVEDAYGLFAERKIFYPDFKFCVNTSVGVESFVDQKGKCDLRIIIEGKAAPIYNVRIKAKGNIIDMWFEDREGFDALMRVTLLPNGKMQMYFPPEKTETAEIFVRYFNQPRTIAYSWYEPTLDGFIFHPDAKTGQEAVKKYYTKTFNQSFNSIVSDGLDIIANEYKKRDEERRRQEIENERKRAEAERKREEEARKREEERKRYIRENTVLVTLEAPRIGRDVTIELNDKIGINEWRDSLLVGEYTVKCTSDSYKTLTQKIKVTKKDTSFVLDMMTPKTISYTFTSPDKETGANVYVNDTYVGKTPVIANINLIEPNKIEYNAIGYKTRRFYLTYDHDVTISTSPDHTPQKVSCVKEYSNNSLTAKMKKHRSGGIDKDGNAYLYKGCAVTTYPSFVYGIATIESAKEHFNSEVSLNLNFRDENAYFQTGGRIGWGFPGNYLRVTPQIGMDVDWGSKEKIQYNELNELDTVKTYHAAMIYFPIGIKFEYALWRWFVIAATPEASWCGRQKKMCYGVRLNFSLLNDPNHSLNRYKY